MNLFWTSSKINEINVVIKSSQFCCDVKQITVVPTPAQQVAIRLFFYFYSVQMNNKILCYLEGP